MSVSYASTRRLVRALRIQRGLTQEGLAEQAKLDHKYYQRFELGDTPTPSLETLEKLGAIFGLQPWVLICDDPKLVLKHAGLSSAELKEAGKRTRGRPKNSA